MPEPTTDTTALTTALTSALTSAGPPKTFAPKPSDVQNVLYGAFGPPEGASAEEKAAWKAWRQAVDQGRQQPEIDGLRETLEGVMRNVKARDV
jgi:hypothetical protein